MTNLDDLKDALQSPPGFAAQSLDLDAIMAAGGRRRRLRRLAVSATSALAVAAVLAGGGLLARPADRGAPGTPPAAPGPATGSATPSTEQRLGQVVATGMPAKQGEWVFYAVSIDEPRLSGTRFGLMAGRRLADGTIVGVVESNEVSGSDRSPGFHALQAATAANGENAPAFGYFVGDASRFTATVGGKPVKAASRAWSTDPSVTFFWFDPTKVRPGSTIGTVTAYDRNGHIVGSDSHGFGVG